MIGGERSGRYLNKLEKFMEKQRNEQAKRARDLYVQQRLVRSKELPFIKIGDSTYIGVALERAIRMNLNCFFIVTTVNGKIIPNIKIPLDIIREKNGIPSGVSGILYFEDPAEPSVVHKSERKILNGIFVLQNSEKISMFLHWWNSFLKSNKLTQSHSTNEFTNLIAYLASLNDFGKIEFRLINDISNGYRFKVTITDKKELLTSFFMISISQFEISILDANKKLLSWIEIFNRFGDLENTLSQDKLLLELLLINPHQDNLLEREVG